MKTTGVVFAVYLILSVVKYAEVKTVSSATTMYVAGPKGFRPDQLFNVTGKKNFAIL